LHLTRRRDAASPSRLTSDLQVVHPRTITPIDSNALFESFNNSPRLMLHGI
jgi:pyruvate/2-oxoglutarate/acetoin dehydrogenase E1 component